MDFSGKIESLHLTASSRILSLTVLNRIDETCRNLIIDEGDLLVNEKKP